MNDSMRNTLKKEARSYLQKKANPFWSTDHPAQPTTGADAAKYIGGYGLLGAALGAGSAGLLDKSMLGGGALGGLGGAALGALALHARAYRDQARADALSRGKSDMNWALKQIHFGTGLGRNLAALAGGSAVGAVGGTSIPNLVGRTAVVPLKHPIKTFTAPSEAFKGNWDTFKTQYGEFNSPGGKPQTWKGRAVGGAKVGISALILSLLASYAENAMARKDITALKEN